MGGRSCLSCEDGLNCWTLCGKYSKRFRKKWREVVKPFRLLHAMQIIEREKETMVFKEKQYIKDRDEMLKKCDVAEYRKFVEKYKELLGAEFMSKFSKATDEVLEVSLRKMIVAAVNLPFELRKASAVWLVNNGYNLDLRK